MGENVTNFFLLAESEGHGFGSHHGERDRGNSFDWFKLKGSHGTGKLVNLDVHFSRQEKHGKFAKNI